VSFGRSVTRAMVEVVITSCRPSLGGLTECRTCRIRAPTRLCRRRTSGSIEGSTAGRSSQQTRHHSLPETRNAVDQRDSGAAASRLLKRSIDSCVRLSHLPYRFCGVPPKGIKIEAAHPPSADCQPRCRHHSPESIVLQIMQTEPVTTVSNDLDCST